MRAVVHSDHGGPETLAIREIDDPAVSSGHIRVRVRATALNRADILQRKGGYAAPPGWPADIPGLEYAGEVDVTGPGVTRWRRGDRVMGIVGGGAHAELLVVGEDEALPVPDGLSPTEAAAVPEAFLTAFDALTVRGRLRRGERVLVHAVGSGVGTAAVQLARALGAAVLGTSRTRAKLERARALGLDTAIVTDGGSFRGQVGDPVHLVIDVLGAPAFADNLAVLAPLGRLVLLGFLAGSRGELDLGPVLRKRLEIVGSLMRVRSAEERAALAGAARTGLLPLLESRAVGPVIDRVLPMDAIAEAHRVMEGNGTFGKIVLEW
jgi:putative PIG3 family NAD(P)H quinone oxidoreductase